MLRIPFKRLFSTYTYLPQTPVWRIKDLKFDDVDQKESISEEQVCYFDVVFFFFNRCE